ncbi:hypothetical protein BGC07_15785 [Piscirickettsia litoralis]|uniref:Terminase n=2 Tax=Piscirickettsia litoralis TaxID=1891921 RepID=A0ABX2ZYB0_9GAMM|nr:hypothetical protein BGC07_15785 [Piscirickettsia litoralis]
MTLCEWSDNEFLVINNAIPQGKWRTRPYQTEPMECMTDRVTKTITFMKSARVGYTKMLNALTAYHVGHEPTSLLLVQPTVDNAKDYSKEEIAPMLEHVPALKGKVTEATKRDGTNNTLKKFFPGGVMTLVGANSPAGFRRIESRIVLFDEVDGYPLSAGDEGDPITLGKRRADTFPNSKIILGSTPTDEETSKVHSSFLSSDQRYYYVPCPHCSHYQTLRWAGVRWPEGEPHKAHYQCEKCEQPIKHSYKTWMINRGEWRATQPFSGHAGFHISALYSPAANAEWGILAAEFLDAKKDPLKLKGFVNTILGEVWKKTVVKLESDKLYNRRVKYGSMIPDPVVMLTMGVDVQDDRLELEIVGHAPNNINHSITYQVLRGNTQQPEVWQALQKIIQAIYSHPAGHQLHIAGIGIDTGGHSTKAVYEFCSRMPGRVFALKGSSTQGGPLVNRPTKSNLGGVDLFRINTVAFKDTIYNALKNENTEQNYCYFPEDDNVYTLDYFKQLTAERKVLETKNGQSYYRYDCPPGVRNEALDCRVYAMAAYHIINPTTIPLEAIQQAQEKQQARAAPAPTQSAARQSNTNPLLRQSKPRGL